MTVTNISLPIGTRYVAAWCNSAQTHNSVISCLSDGEVLAPKNDYLLKKKELFDFNVVIF